ncbi:MAG: hypothetical protein ACOCQ7_01205 [Natronomonas sp.]
MTKAQDESRRKQKERAEAVQNLLDDVDPDLDEHAYPVASEDLATHYGNTELDLPNETESLGDVFDRLADDYDTPQEARASVLKEISGMAVDSAEFNPERDLDPERAGELGSVESGLEPDIDQPPDELPEEQTGAALDDRARSPAEFEEGAEEPPAESVEEESESESGRSDRNEET